MPQYRTFTVRRLSTTDKADCVEIPVLARSHDEARSEAMRRLATARGHAWWVTEDSEHWINE